jgi:pimeloyl-ACP methyl ester carboxylesterase
VPQEDFVDLDDLRLHVRVWDGPEDAVPVVLLPATGETADDWDVVAAALSAGRPVHAVDLPGHGTSDWCGRYSIEGMAESVVALVHRRAGDGPVDLVGHSLGGLVACRVAAAVPRLIRRLVLEDVGLLHPRPAAAPPRPAGVLPFDWRVVEQVRPQVDRPASDWPAVLRAITAPTLVIAGGAASPVSPAQVAELLDLVADSRSVTVEAGHLVHAHAPEAFVQHLVDFLDTGPPDDAPGSELRP